MFRLLKYNAVQESEWLETLVSLTQCGRPLLQSKAILAHAFTMKIFPVDIATPELLAVGKQVHNLSNLTLTN